MASVLYTAGLLSLIVAFPVKSRETRFGRVADSSTLNVLVMGDWGGEYTGNKNAAEENTAQLMGQLAEDHDIAMCFGVGDNFYPSGVTDVNDPRFNQTFEDIFTAKSLSEMDYWFVAGNHDYKGNVTAEVDYTDHSDRWKFPNEWYSFVIKDASQTFSMEIVMIDTCLLCGFELDDRMPQHYDEKGRMKMGGRDWSKQDEIVAQDQWNWIEDTLKSSTADYLIVMGHYPVWSIAEHGPTPCLVSQLLPMLQKYEVTAYVNGHDHTFEFIESEQSEKDGTIHQAFVTSGGNHGCDTSTQHENSVPNEYTLKYHDCNDGGMTWIQATADRLEFKIMVGQTTDIDFKSDAFYPRH